MVTFRGRLTGPLRIAVTEADPEVRGFHLGEPAKVERLRSIGRTFIAGYTAALEGRPAEIADALEPIPAADRGFAYEGAAMALAILDMIAPYRRRLADFASGAGNEHVYMVNVGAGWALARLPRRVTGYLSRLDPLLGWLAVDGYGFHEGYFHAPRTIGRQERPRRIPPPAGPVFDQGLGRSLWFVECADVERIWARVLSFAPSRRDDLWAGVGLAAAYAGGVDAAELEELRRLAGPEAAPHLGQGAAFAARARQRAGNPTPATEMACRTLCGMPAGAAADITQRALGNLGTAAGAPRYERWRANIRDRVAQARVS